MSTKVVAVAAAAVTVGACGLYLRRSVLAEGSTSPPKKVFGGFPPLKSLKLQSAEMVNHDTKKLRFEFPDKEATSGLSLTSATLTVSFPNGGWRPVPRPYTPVGDLNQKGFIEFLVKHYPNGVVSTHLHSLKPGDSIYFMPIAGYAWTPNKHKHVAMIAGGAGITPIYQLARGILSNPSDKTRITLVWGVNGDQDLFLAEEFQRMEREHPGRFRAVYTVAKPEAGSKHAKGFITRELLQDAGVMPGEDLKVLVCGSPPMESSLVGKKGWFGGGDGGILGELGFTKDQIHQF